MEATMMRKPTGADDPKRRERMLEHGVSTTSLMFASLPVVLGVLILVVAIPRLSAMTSTTEWDEQTASSFTVNATNITFIALQEPDWKLLAKALQAYEREQHNLLQQLSRSLEVALQTEADYGLKPVLSSRLQTRISTLAELLAQDLDLLQSKLLVPFEHVRVLVAEPEEDAMSLAKLRRRRESSNEAIIDDSSPHQLGYYTPIYKSSTSDSSFPSSSYDSVAQVVAHLVRDWTDEGHAIRNNLYAWCVDQVQNHATQQSSLSILVPGAGLGRLAHDLASQGHSVHAVEMSLTMAAAAASVLRTSNVSQHIQLHPYLMDALTNEVDSQLRYTSVMLHKPDFLPPHASLSYSLANFLDLPLSTDDHYHTVVTCFFIDTATNVIDYIHKIHSALYPGGVWINVGPIQWHRNAQLFPSGNELHALIESMGFKITSWSVDAAPMEYRNRNETTTRSTHFDAYCPVRFVAVKGSDENE